MKTKFFALFLGLTCFIMISCNQEDLVPSPSIEASVSPKVVKYGGDVTITWNSLNSDYVTINNVKMTECCGSIIFKNLTFLTKYEVIAVGPVESAKETLNVPVDKAEAPIVVVKALTEAIPFGSFISFSWTIEGLYNTVTINNIDCKSNNFSTPILFEDKEYTLFVSGPGGTFSQKVLVQVGDWKTSKIGIVDHERYILKSLTYITDGIAVDSIHMKDVGERIFHFSKEGKLITYDSSGSPKNNWGWHFEGEDTIFIAGSPYKITKLTLNEFVYTVTTIHANKPSVFEYAYYR